MRITLERRGHRSRFRVVDEHGDPFVKGWLFDDGTIECTHGTLDDAERDALRAMIGEGLADDLTFQVEDESDG